MVCSLFLRAPFTHPTALRWSTSLCLRRKEVKNDFFSICIAVLVGVEDLSLRSR